MAEDPPRGAATITFVTDGIDAAVAKAKAVAGDRNVMLHGAGTAQQCLRAGLLDELELTRVVDAPGITHLHYRVRQGRP
jgi:dihydrofolate reductase